MFFPRKLMITFCMTLHVGLKIDRVCVWLYGSNKGNLEPGQSRLVIGAQTYLMEHDRIYGQTKIAKEMKFSYTPNKLVDTGSPM